MYCDQAMSPPRQTKLRGGGGERGEQPHFLQTVGANTKVTGSKRSKGFRFSVWSMKRKTSLKPSLQW
jgi:hypothetical protein